MLQNATLDFSECTALMYRAMGFKYFSVRNIPESVWKKVRQRAIREGTSLQALFMRWIQNYAEGK